MNSHQYKEQITSKQSYMHETSRYMRRIESKQSTSGAVKLTHPVPLRTRFRYAPGSVTHPVPLRTRFRYAPGSVTHPVPLRKLGNPNQQNLNMSIRQPLGVWTNNIRVSGGPGNTALLFLGATSHSETRGKLSGDATLRTHYPRKY